METLVKSESIRTAEEGFDLVRLASAFWASRIWILAGTLAAGLLGTLIAITADPVYQAKAIIAQKEIDKPGGNASMLSKLGGLGGLVGNQLGVGNTTLDRIEIILKGHELADSVLARNDLIPRLFPKLWDPGKGAWKVKDPAKIPGRRMVIDMLRSGILNVMVDSRKGIIEVAATAPDSVLVRDIVQYYLDALNEKLLMDVKRDAEINRAYLETQLANTSDPMLREKISNMIGMEIEKYMLVSNKSIEILERPVVPLERTAPKRRKIVVMSLFGGFLFSCFCLFAFLFVRKNLEDYKVKRDHD